MKIEQIRESNEMEILRGFVEEFSPLHQEQTSDYKYDELVQIVNEIAEEL